MSTPATSQPIESSRATSSPWATGFAMFAGVLMITGGVCGVLAGLAAIFRDQIYVSTPAYTYALDLTAWGWVHLILGVVLALAGMGVLQGATWARVVGITVAGISLIVHFAFIPHYPLWSIVIIALNVVVIWALATYREAV